MNYIKKLIEIFKVKVLRMPAKNVNAIRPFTEKDVDIILDSMMLADVSIVLDPFGNGV